MSTPAPGETAIVPKPPSGPYSKLWKVAWYIANTAVQVSSLSLLDFYDEIQHRSNNAEDPPATNWVRWQVRFADLGSGEPADDQFFTLDTVNYTNGTIDNTWTDTDFQNVLGNLDGFLTSVGGYISDHLQADQISAYFMAYNAYDVTDPDDPNKHPPFAPAGPPVRRYSVVHPGSGTGGSHPCGSSTVTEMTAERIHWGRFYLPQLAGLSYETNGRLKVAVVDGIAAAAAQLLSSLEAYQLPLVVPVTRSNKHDARFLLNVNQIRVDDVADVIRSRRTKIAQHRSTLPVVTARPAAA